MPKIRVSAPVIVATLLLAACGGGGEPSNTAPTEAETTAPTEGAAADVAVVGTAGFQFQPSEVQASAGTISVALTSEGGPHTFTLELDSGNETVAQVFTPGETNIGEVELEAGTYIFFCTIPGHREEGMAGTLTVS